MTSPIILQVLLYLAALLVSCGAAQAHTLLGQPHYAVTQWHMLDHVPKLAEALHVVALIALSKWLSLLLSLAATKLMLAGCNVLLWQFRTLRYSS